MMKTGAKKSNKAPVEDEFPIEPQKSPFLQVPSDPIAAEVNQMGLIYLGYAAGVIQTAPDSLQSVNVEMWPIDQIFKLRSELIALSIIIDEHEKAIQKDRQIGYENFVTELHENEDEEALKFQHLSTNVRKPVKETRFDPLARPGSPMLSLPPSQIIPHSRSRADQLPRSRTPSAHLRRSTSTSSIKQLTQDSLWENVDLFMHPIEKLNHIQQYMIQTRPKTTADILNEPIGPHYSTTIGRDPSVMSDPIKSRLKIPPPPADLTGNTDNRSYLHSRLVSAVVPLLETTDNFSKFIVEDQATNNTTILNDFQCSENNSTPTAESSGFTGYGYLNFEERLEMELSYVGIEGSGNVVTTYDCPIAQDLSDALKEQEEVVKEVNKWKKIMADLIQSKKSVLEERSRRHKEWTHAMNHFFAQEKSKNQQDKKKNKPSHLISTESE